MLNSIVQWLFETNITYSILSLNHEVLFYLLYVISKVINTITLIKDGQPILSSYEKTSFFVLVSHHKALHM